uniref:non-specific serine/threonine protein kinase n=1 Tax=Salix viminalis TaxID=40686 RepID=A0A6N2L7F8_SALVM
MILEFIAQQGQGLVSGLDSNKMEALLEVATQLGKKGWNRNMKLCNEIVTVLPPKQEDNKVVCNCSFPGGVYLKSQDLNGSLPKAIQKLPHLKELSLWANYLSGNIPSEWADTKLEILSLGVNRLSGKIPIYLGRITTLRFLNIENNMFSGTVPPELGDLVNLENLTLSANNLSGELPLSLGNLIRLKELRLSRNNFTGRIPEFILSWKQLDALEIQAGGFTGPIPSNISLLTKRYSMHINCGGPAATIGKTTYEADDEPGGAAKYVYTREAWQKSTTGHIWDVKNPLHTYTAQSMSILRMENSVLYTNASLTPSSLTYYVPCLANGNYTVKLHFAEIVMRDNRSYSTLGRRVFDVYIQNIVVLKDFNIVTKAGGVDKGVLSDGTQIAVKQLSAKSKQGNREFVNEIGMISALQHPNLVRLYGCCIEGKQLLLVYEYMENNSLAHVLFGTKEIEATKLDWRTRQRICVNIAKGLVFLHEESTLKIVHRDIKGTNILLDKDMNAKISDFGMAKLDDEDNTHIDTRVAGTIFGVVALEIVSGMNNAKFRRGENFVCLLDWWKLYLKSQHNWAKKAGIAICHCVTIQLQFYLKSQMVTIKLSATAHFLGGDLWANYLSGNIPLEWAGTKLELLSLGVNRLNGKIPSYLGNITTLRYLSIENNMFSGTVPPELGDLVNLENLTLSANNLSGELPSALANLTELKALRLSRNNFTGRIPEFIQSWKQLDALEIEAGGFTGPIPSNISLLTNLTDLQIKTATNDFDAVNKLGEGGFGCVYKGVLSDGTQIAVKQLSAKSKQGNREFVNEIGMISALQHPNLVRLYGCCIEGKQLLLVYEYMENNSLAHVLFGTKEIEATKLDWRTRQRICVNIAKGLVFLHEESTLKIVHRDIKDVYSFGVVALEIVSGMNNAKFRRGENFVCLLDWVLYLQTNGDIMEMVDPSLGSAFNKKEVVRMINVALLCTNQSPALRPIMSTVVSMLEGKTDVEELVMVPSTSSDQSGYATTTFNKLAQASFNGSSSETKSLAKSLWANYLSGNIPSEWADTKLELLSLGVNRLNGTIPSYLGNITTLRSLNIENNMFSGTVPPELGDLVNLENLTLSANNLSGELPLALANLIRLKELRLSRNNFTGRIPEFIQSWKQLDAFEIQAAATIGKTIYEADDEPGGAAKYVSTRRDWQKSTTGHIWDVKSSSDSYIAQNMSILRMDNSVLYTNASLTPSSLTYYVPCLANGNYTVKLHFAEIVIRDNRSYYSLGRRVFDVYIQPQRMTLMQQTNWEKAVLAVSIKDLWANYLSGNIPPEWAVTKLEFLSIGVNRLSGKIPSYLGKITTLRYLSIENNMFSGTVPPELGDLVNLESLTLSANNLSGELPLALANLIGLKTLRLSRNNFTGRIPEFIQSWKQLNALEIEAERYSVHINCGGPAATIGKTIYEADNEPGGAAKYVSTRRDWQKSTTGHFWDVKPSSDSYIAQNMSILRMNNSVLYTNASLTPLSLTYYVRCLVNGNYNVKLHFAEIVMRDKRSYYSLGRRVFDVYIQNIVVLKDFDIVTKAGGVDKGVLSDGTQIAVKQLSAKSKQGNREFVNEIGMISALQHPNLVRLYGCCIEGKQLLLVYEYMENNSLAHVLFGTKEIEATKLDWRTRKRICVNIAKGLVFLHEESTLKIVHRDIKGTNILLDKDMNAKISDFGMAKLYDEDNTHIDTRWKLYLKSQHNWAKKAGVAI